MEKNVANPKKSVVFYYPKINLNKIFNREYLSNCAKMSKHTWRPSSAHPGFGYYGKFIDKSAVVYQLTITTGKSATNANVYVKIIGKYGVVNKQRLNLNHFPVNSTRICNIIGPEIGDIKCILVETDAFDENDCWYLRDIVIENCRTQQTWYIPCNSWLSLWRGDGKVSKYFPAKNHQNQLPQLTAVNFIDFEITTVTGSFPSAGTSANISITFYGENGVSPKIQLVCNDGDCFRSGSKDKFLVSAPNVGEINQIKIQHDCTGNSPSWYLEKVIVINLENSRIFCFPCNSWLNINTTYKYLHLSNDEAVDNFKVSIFTGKEIDAETDSKVYITLFGLYGDSGENILQNGTNNFQRGSVNHFYLTTNKLGPLKRIKIRHDNSGFNSSWYLENIIVENVGTSEKFHFSCHRWLSDNKDDGKIERYLVLDTPSDYESFSPVLYTIKIATGNMLNSKTTSAVFIILYGGCYGRETSGKIWLKGGKFYRGTTDSFDIEIPVLLSPLSRLVIGHDNSGSEPAWFLSTVTVFCLENGIEQVFVCNKWFARDEGDGQIVRELFEDEVLRKCRKRVIPWIISVFTGNNFGSGTNCDVKIILYGNLGKSDEFILRNDNRTRLQEGQVDKFQFATKDVGTPVKIQVSKLESENRVCTGWYLEKIEFCNKFTMQSYLFSCYKWFSKVKDDGRIIREIAAEGPGIFNPLPVVQYSVNVYTGNKLNAGTNADVLINIFGDFGDTGYRSLQEEFNVGNKFAPGQVDEFILEAVNLGKLEKIKVRHRGMTSEDRWFFEKIIIRQLGFHSETIFWFNGWLMNEEKIIYPLSI